MLGSLSDISQDLSSLQTEWGGDIPMFKPVRTRYTFQNSWNHFFANLDIFAPNEIGNAHNPVANMGRNDPPKDISMGRNHQNNISKRYHIHWVPNLVIPNACASVHSLPLPLRNA